VSPPTAAARSPRALSPAARSPRALSPAARSPRALSPAQVALNWLLCNGVVPIPGAKNAQQASDNAGAIGWRLTDSEVEEVGVEEEEEEEKEEEERRYWRY